MRSTVPPHYTAWRITLVAAVSGAIILGVWLLADTGFFGMFGAAR